MKSTVQFLEALDLIVEDTITYKLINLDNNEVIKEEALPDSNISYRQIRSYFNNVTTYHKGRRLTGDVSIEIEAKDFNTSFVFKAGKFAPAFNRFVSISLDENFGMTLRYNKEERKEKVKELQNLLLKGRNFAEIFAVLATLEQQKDNFYKLASKTGLIKDSEGKIIDFVDTAKIENKNA